MHSEECEKTKISVERSCYGKMSAEYLLLFNMISQTIEELDTLKERLIKAQQKAEDLYIDRSA